MNVLLLIMVFSTFLLQGMEQEGTRDTEINVDSVLEKWAADSKVQEEAKDKTGKVFFKDEISNACWCQESRFDTSSSVWGDLGSTALTKFVDETYCGTETLQVNAKKNP